MLAPRLLLQLLDLELEDRVLQRDPKDLAQGGRRRVRGRPDRAVLEAFWGRLSGSEDDEGGGNHGIRVAQRLALESELLEDCGDLAVLDPGRDVDVEGGSRLHRVHHRPSAFWR